MNILDQDILRELESKCTQEQPPAAMAACPLHVDCRALCAAIAADDFDAARAVYSKSVTFPSLLSLLCKMPCGKSCVRHGFGGEVNLRALEQAVVVYGNEKPKRGLPLRKNGTAAVIGAGICGLTAALELGKKGYAVTVFEKENSIGGGLLKAGLPDGVLSAELKAFEAYPVEFRLGAPAPETQTLISEYDAVLIAVGGAAPDFDTVTLQTQTNGVFAVGGYDSVVFSIAAGRRAAISIDRFIKKVSLTAGRGNESPYETGLFVETSGIQICEPASGIASRADAVQEAGRCLDCKCLECAKSCAFISHFKRYPRKYVREVYNNLSIAMGNRTGNTLINSCALCSQCAAVCPNGLDLGQVMLSARRIMVQTGKMPASAFEFAVDDMQNSNGDRCFIARNQPGYEESKHLFFPGCQLGASAPEIVKKAYSHLSTELGGGVGLLLGCCGITARWAGREELFTSTREKLLEEWRRLGEPKIITACPTCRKTLGGDFGEITDIWTVLLETGFPTGHIKRESYLIHDACGARDESASREDIRKLLQLLGCEIAESPFGGEKSLCCGYGGLVQFSNSEVADEMTQLCTRDVDRTRLTYCMNCRDRFTKAGSRAVHILELVYGDENAESRDAPGYSLRRDNRERLRRDMLKEFWNEEQREPGRLPIVYDADVAGMLEKRLILDDDIREVISGAVESGGFIKEAKTGLMIANKRLGNVTFWVHFTQENDGWRVLRAYSHRMEIKQDN